LPLPFPLLLPLHLLVLRRHSERSEEPLYLSFQWEQSDPTTSIITEHPHNTHSDAATDTSPSTHHPSSAP
jgi:hypothetical protein